MNATEKVKRSVSLHREASMLSGQAFQSRFEGDEDGFLRFTREASKKEASAAALLRHDPSHHMHAILHRSAATLAYRCGHYDEAEKLIAHGLTGGASDLQREELYDLLGKVRLSLDLELIDAPRPDNELELTLQGPEADAGLLDVNTLLSQIKDWSSLLRSTIRYVLSYEFKASQASESGIRVFAAPPAKGSFKINMRFMRVGNQLSLPMFDTAAISTRIMNDFRTLQSGDLSLLRSTYDNDNYFHRFMKHAEDVAPDGKTVTTLGIRATVENKLQSVLFDRTADEIRSVYEPPIPDHSSKEYQVSEESITVTGTLLLADATSEDEELKLITDDNKEWRIHLSAKSEPSVGNRYYKSRVRVMGRHKYRDRKSNLLELSTIERV